MKAPSFVRLQIKRKWSSLVFLPVNSCVSNSRVWIAFLIEPQAFFFFLSANRRSMLWHYDCTAMTARLQPQAGDDWFSCLLSGPDTKCSICQANAVVYVRWCACCICVSWPCVFLEAWMLALQPMKNTFTSAYTVVIYSMHICIHCTSWGRDKSMSGIHPALYAQLFVRSFQVSVQQEPKHGLD